MVAFGMDRIEYLNGKEKILSLMEREKVNELIIDRNYLPEILSKSLLILSAYDGLPELEPYISDAIIE